MNTSPINFSVQKDGFIKNSAKQDDCYNNGKVYVVNLKCNQPDDSTDYECYAFRPIESYNKSGDTFELQNKNSSAKTKSALAALLALGTAFCCGVVIVGRKAQEASESAPVQTKPAVVQSTDENERNDNAIIITEPSEANINEIHNNGDDSYVVVPAFELEPIEQPEAEVVETDKEKEFLYNSLDEKLGWGFSEKLQQIAKNVNCDVEDLVGLMFSESQLDPYSISDDTGAVGLIQFTEDAASDLGTTTWDILNMSAIEQLDYVEGFLNYWRNVNELPEDKKLDAGELYALTFVPSYIKNDILVSEDMPEYSSNEGLDTNSDGDIAKYELAQKIYDKYQEYLKSAGWDFTEE